MHQFVRIDLGKEPVPDETTTLNFRHLVEHYNLGDEMFWLVNVCLAENGLKVNRGTNVDATIIDAPTSTKNKDKVRDSDMRQTRKSNQWYFGMRAHIGVDNKTKLIHSVAVTKAEQSANRCKSKSRSQVEHVFGVMKRYFGFTQVWYRGLDKNVQCVFTKCALVNLVLAKKKLLAA